MLNEVKNLANTCPCGDKHSLVTDKVVIGNADSINATSALCDYVGEHYKKPLIVCDTNTEKYAGEITKLLRTAEVIVLPGDSHADESGTAPLEKRLGSGVEYDCLIACGSGSLHDIARYCSNAFGLHFLSYPTAASVDGFVSTVAAMTFKGQKLSTTAAAPVALFADYNVYSDAPAKLTASGISDILGKYTALCDWRIAHILTGEQICPHIAGLMENALGRLINLLEKKASGEILTALPEYTQLVMESLVLAGLAMQLQGNSRPASGAEHHMSHLWEMQVINSPTHALHGEQVGVASLILADFYRRKLDEGYDFTRMTDLRATFERSYIESSFGSLTDGILDENLTERNPESSPLNFLATNESAALARAEISKLIRPEKLLRYLEIAGAPTTLSELSLPDNPEFIAKSLAIAPYVRRRLTLLKILSSKR